MWVAHERLLRVDSLMNEFIECAMHALNASDLTYSLQVYADKWRGQSLHGNLNETTFAECSSGFRVAVCITTGLAV